MERETSLLGNVDHLCRLRWLAGWCAGAGVTLDLEGEIGFGRECVGILDGHEYICWDWQRREPSAGPGPEAPDAYHKSDSLAVLGRGEEAEKQLHDWVKRLADAGGYLERGVPKEMPDLGSLLGRHTQTCIRLPELPRAA